MAKKSGMSPIDFHFGVGTIIPSKQPGYTTDGKILTPKPDGASLSNFKLTVDKDLEAKLSQSKQFPSRNEIFVMIIQFFVGQTDYRGRDLDNMAKTMLDVLKGKFYYDDGQVKTLLVSKRIDRRIPQNFAYIAVTEIRGGNEVEAIKQSGLERSITYYCELKSHGGI